ncbi:MAG: hypothetical protein ACOYJU_00805 [Anaerovoracaceae bacterium]|jgi:hypothetical protein
MAYTTAGYGATINGYHTLRNLGLVIGNNDIVSSPTPKINIIDIPGASKRIDLTETLSGNVEFEGRTLKFEFGIQLPKDRWAETCRMILNTFHGRKVRVILDQEPEFYYEGRAEVDGFDRAGTLGTFVMTVNADAYKYDISGSLGDWEWDSFNFETGYIREYDSIAVDGSTNKMIEGSSIPVTPTFHVSDYSNERDAYITYNGTRYPLVEGENRFADLVIPPSGGRLYIYGKYTLGIEFRGGSL